MLLMYTEYVQVQWDPIFQPDFNSPPKLKEIRKNQITSGRDRSHRQASQVGGTGLSRAGIIAGGWGRSFTGRYHQVGGVGLTGRHHRRWAGHVSHRQVSSQAGGAGLSQAGIIAGGWGRHHRRWVGEVSHRQAFQQILINLQITYIYIYILL